MRIFYRIRQFIISILLKIIRQREPIVLDSLIDICDILDQKHKRVFIVTTCGFIKRKSLDALFSALDENDIKYEIFTDIKPDPMIDDIEKGVLLYNSSKSEAIIGIGGGSVMDTAKAIGARIVRPDKSLYDMAGVLKIRKRLPLMILAPTTVGTGSEASMASVVTGKLDGDLIKFSISDFNLISDYAVLDCDLINTLSPNMTATTGMDALTHAVESYINLFAGKITKTNSTIAVNLIFNNIKSAVGGDKEAKKNMLMASFHAGIAFSHNFVGYVHAISHAIGAIYHLPHGLLNAIVLPVVLEAYGDEIHDKLDELARASSLDIACEEFIKAIYDMNETFDIPRNIADLKEEDYDDIINRAIKEANPLYPVPVIWKREDFKRVLDRLRIG